MGIIAGASSVHIMGLLPPRPSRPAAGGHRWAKRQPESLRQWAKRQPESLHIWTRHGGARPVGLGSLRSQTHWSGRVASPSRTESDSRLQVANSLRAVRGGSGSLRVVRRGADRARVGGALRDKRADARMEALALPCSSLSKQLPQSEPPTPEITRILRPVRTFQLASCTGTWILTPIDEVFQRGQAIDFNDPCRQS